MDHGSQPLTDADLDREIQTALAVEPSPQLVARVRTEVGNQPIAPRLPWGWTISVACTVVLAIFVSNGVRSVPRLKPSPTEVNTQPEVSKPAELPSSAGISERGPRISKIPMTAGTATLAKTSVAHEPAMPEVIVDPEDLQAFEQLIISVRERRFEATFDERPTSTPWVMTELNVPPIIIEPLEPPAANN